MVPTRRAGLVGDPGIEAPEKCPAAGEHDAALHRVGSQLRWRLVEAELHGIDDRLNRFLDDLAHLLSGDDDRPSEDR